MGLLKVSASNTLGRRLLGEEGSHVFIIGAYEWGTKHSKVATTLGFYQKMQNHIYSITKGYMQAMQDRAEENYMAYLRPFEHGDSEASMSSNFFNKMVKGGKFVIGEFGNHSPHARYFEWGTGPMGEKYMSSNITKTQLDIGGRPNYRQDGWTYYNEDFEQFMYTRGMEPRPFVYPAFLNYRSALVQAISRMLRAEGERVENVVPGQSNPHYGARAKASERRAKKTKKKIDAINNRTMRRAKGRR